MKNIVIGILFLASNTLVAQIESIIKNPKVGWVAQGSMDIQFDALNYEAIKSLESSRSYYSGAPEILKLLELQSEFTSDGYNHFAKILFSAIYKKKVKIYSDSTCTKEINILNINVDSIEVIDPINFEPKVKVVHNNFDPNKCVYFRVFQTFIYKPEKSSWEIRTESIAPIYIETTSYGSISFKPIFWIKADNNKHTSDKNLSWKVRTQTAVFPKYRMNELKISRGDMPIEHYVNYFKKNSSVPFYNAEKGWKNKIRLTESDKINLFKSRTDTIDVINPETFKPETRLNVFKVDSESITGIKFIQEWHWDKKKNIISSQLKAIAPLLSLTDPQGNFLLNTVLFYKRIDE